MGQLTSIIQSGVGSTSSHSRVSTPGRMNDLEKAVQRWSYSYPKATSTHALEVTSEKGELKQDLASSIRPIVVPFIQGLGHKPSTQLDNERLWLSSLAKVASMDIPCPENSGNWKRLKVGFSYAHHCYPNHPLEVQVFIAVFTLLVQQLDDFTPEGMQDIEKFVPRLCTGEQQPTNVLRGLAQLMLEVHDHWSPVPANLIISSCLNFVTSAIIEHKRLVRRETQFRSGKAWAYYLRNLDGLGDAFAIFTFPSALYPDTSKFLQAIPDMAMYIVFANDIISFYKEELAGEDGNYAHSRAIYNSKDVVTTLNDIVEDTEACYRRIRELLMSGGSDGQPYAKAWQAHEQGYIDFHRNSGRYKLEKLGLSF
ncbi:uncharacterized protein BP5553_04795 [Venustampulla echinocandica]|uniref:Terpenoid synthase n=1 Tax=Venustampulla echinocandica TaxID=2656787 RepID=A0A370TPC0_9HELO|nr:uncharacterized protein BP5553_04795 [Venustampulla echinocandica]RDL37362.1 hypothetical protein BP5553_04795 [Venustampulla echinocandica]